LAEFGTVDDAIFINNAFAIETIIISFLNPCFDAIFTIKL
jgi:hypothetical protein